MNVERIDFFVHPDYYGRPNMHGEIRDAGYSEAYGRYIGGISTAIGIVSNPVLLFNTELGTRYPDMSDELFERFDSGMRFPTHTGNGIVHGLDNAKAILGMIQDRKPSELIVHGSYLSMCVHQFAQGLQIAMAASEPERLSIVGRNVSGLAEIDWSKQTPVKLGTSLTLAFGERDKCVPNEEVSDLIPHLTTFLDEEVTKVYSAER